MSVLICVTPFFRCTESCVLCRCAGGSVDVVAFENSVWLSFILFWRPLLIVLITVVPLFWPSTVIKWSSSSTWVTWSSGWYIVNSSEDLVNSFEAFAFALVHAIRHLSLFWFGVGDAGSKELLIMLLSLTDWSGTLIATTGCFPKHLFNLQRCTIFVFLERPSALRTAFTSLNISVTKYGPFHLGLNLGFDPTFVDWSRTHTLSPTLKFAPLTVRSYKVLALNEASSRFAAAISNMAFISFFCWSTKSEAIHSTSIFALSSSEFVWSYTRSIGNLGIRPNISSKGENLVTAWTAVLYANESLFSFLSQSFCLCSLTNWVSIVLIVLLKRSVMPSVWGWYAVVRSVCTSRRSHRLSTIWLVTFEPWSVSTDSGIPNVRQ